MTKAAFPDMESDLEIVVRYLDFTVRIPRLTFTDPRQRHCHAENDQAMAQHDRGYVVVAKYTYIIIFTFEEAVKSFTLLVGKRDKSRRTLQMPVSYTHLTLPTNREV